MAATPTTIDKVLASARPDQRAALERLRKIIQAAAPEAEEGFSYGLPAFRLDGRPLVAFAAATKHCAFYPMSSALVEAHQKELRGFDTSKGTIRFQPDEPLPASLVRKFVKARIEQIRNGSAGVRRSSGTAGKQRLPARTTKSRTNPVVEAFLRDLKHPLKKEVEAIRRIILGVSPAIREGIKWSAPSFRTTDDFATFNLCEGRAWLILHTGARAKGRSMRGAITDPAGILKWLARDRGLVTFSDGPEVKAKRKPLEAILREWIELM